MAVAAGAPHRTAPGPRGELLTGNLAAYKRDPIQMILDAQREHGDIARQRLGPYLVHTLTHPDHVKHVLQDNNQNYCRGNLYENFKIFFGNGLLTTDGKYWLRHRRIAQPLFHRKVVDACADTIGEAAEGMLTRWGGVAARGEVVDIVPEMMRLSLGVLGRVIFGHDLGEDADIVSPAVRFGAEAMMPQGNLNDFLPQWVPTPHNRRVAEARQILRQTMRRIIATHEQSGAGPSDLITLLISARDDQTGEGLTAEEIEDEVITIFLAGHETTGSGLAWTLYAIAQHVEVRRRLEEEVDGVLDGGAPSLEALARMPYLRQVIDEALRVYPPIWGYTRDAIEDDEIGGYHIPAGSTVFLSPYATHRHPDFWENPCAFDPERFTPERSAGRHRLAYFPFGGGPRKCIGSHLALLQMQIAVAMIVQRFHLHLRPGQSVRYGRMVSLRPLPGISVTLHPRRS
jgi:cytochrome P450